jgi:hypothetical protein
MTDYEPALGDRCDRCAVVAVRMRNRGFGFGAYAERCCQLHTHGILDVGGSRLHQYRPNLRMSMLRTWPG